MFELLGQRGNSIFDNYFGEDFAKLMDTGKGLSTDIHEKKDGYEISMNIPGYTKDEIEISCKNEILTISAEKKVENTQENDGYIRRERYFGRRERSFSLKGLDQETIDANLKDGVLTIDIKKDDKYIEDKKIQIK